MLHRRTLAAGVESVSSECASCPHPRPWHRPDTHKRAFRQGRRSGHGWKRVKPPKGSGEQGRPAPGALQAEEYAPAAAGDAAGDVNESMAEPLGFPAARLAIQAEPLEE